MIFQTKNKGGVFINTDIKEKIKNVQSEVLLVGSFYKNPDLYVENKRYIKSTFDLTDNAVKFFYELFETMYQTFSTEFNDNNIKVFVSQDKDRLFKFNNYNGLDTIHSWKKLAIENDFANYLQLVKKYSVIRQYYKFGFNLEKLFSHSKFDTMTAEDVGRYFQAVSNKIHSTILSNTDSKVATDGIIDLVESSVEIPDMGIPLPYPIINEAIRGWRLGTFGVTGMLSNEGKTRYLVKLVCHTAFYYNEKILVMLNETSEKEFKYCLLTTVINNTEFQDLHGIKIKKREREIAKGLYRDNNGKFVFRKTDEFGNYTETTEEYLQRLRDTSQEYNQVMQVSKWLEEQSQGKIFIKELEQYDDDTLEFEINKHITAKQIEYFAYDTIKNDLDSIGDWAKLKKTCTKLSELAKNKHIAIYGSIQLTDDAVHLNIFDLTSNNIANAKQLKHVADYLFLARQIPIDTYKIYQYKSLSKDWGVQVATDLDNNKVYYGSKTDKNRVGNKPIVCYQVDLDTNEWFEIGVLLPKMKIPESNKK